MSKTYAFNRAQRRAAKRLGLPEELNRVRGIVRDPIDKIPIFSPALALILCSVHGQRIADAVISSDGDSGVGFKANKVVKNALKAWQKIQDSFEENEMPYNELLQRYLRLVSGSGNCKMICMLEAEYGRRVPQSNMGNSKAQ